MIENNSKRAPISVVIVSHNCCEQKLLLKKIQSESQAPFNNKVDRRTSTLVTLLICFALLADCIEFLKYLVIVLQFVDCS